MSQQQNSRSHPMLVTAYDPSRDSSPNLPTPSTSCLNHESASRISLSIKDEYDEPTDLYRGGSGRALSEERTFAERLPPEEEDEADGLIYQRYDSTTFYDRENPRIASPPEDKCCAGCGELIADRFYLFAVERSWHASCLQCSQCRRTLDNEVSCFARDGNIYCRKDYQRLFVVNRCARCKGGISRDELVMRARHSVFHLSCFSCVVCNTVLTKGDQFGMRGVNELYCTIHYHVNAVAPPNADHDLKPTTSFFNVTPTPRPKGRPRKRKPKELDLSNLDLNSEYMLEMPFGPGTPMGGGSSSQHHRSKRMRTSFKHHQLRTMKTYFTVNHNPDAKDLKQLSQKTGLAKRVLQVWFQNARAKWRRMMNKQEGSGGGAGMNLLKSSDDKSCSGDSNASSGGITDYQSGPLSISSLRNSPSSQHYHHSPSSMMGD